MTFLGDILLGAAGSLLASFVERRLQSSPEGFAAARVDAKIKEIACAIMEPLTEFLIREGANEDLVEKIIEEVLAEVNVKLLGSSRFVELGLDVDRITQDLLDGMTSDLAKELSVGHPEQFHMITRAFVQLAVDVPPIFANWETKKFQTHYKQIDELRNTFAQIYEKMETMSAAVMVDQQLLDRICAYKLSLSALKLTIHGLRQSAIPQADIDELFVQPKIIEYSATEQIDDVIGRDIVQTFDSHEPFLMTTSPGDKILLTASAGAGKSTWSEWIGIRALTGGHPKFALVKQLRKMENFKEAPSLLELIMQETPGSFSEQISSSEVAEWSRNGQIFIIFDGLDEVAEGLRDDALLWIESILAAYPGCIATVTSRPLSTEHSVRMLKEGWGNFQIAPFDDTRVEEYISKFQQHGPDVMTGAKKLPAQVLASQWMKDPTIGPLTRNPLLLSTLLVVHHMDGELPDDRAQLYERYVDGMLGLWETKKELVPPSIPLTKVQKLTILQAIAINMISAEVDAAGQNTASSWIEGLVSVAGYDGKAVEVLEHLRERSGLLIGPGQYTFAHKSVGEFLTASACLEGIFSDVDGLKYDEELLFSNCSKDRWNTVLFLWAGLAPSLSVQVFIDRLIDLGNLSVAGGLLYDRRKFLDREWLRSAFWRLVKKGTAPGGFLEHETNSHFVSPGHFHGPNKVVVSAYAHDFASVASEVDERELLNGLLELDLFTAEDLVNQIEECGWSFWFHFQSATDFEHPDNIHSLSLEHRTKGEFATAYEAARVNGSSNEKLLSAALDLLENERIFEACQIAFAQDLCEGFVELANGSTSLQEKFELQDKYRSVENDPIFRKLFREGHYHESFRSGEFDNARPTFHKGSTVHGMGSDIASVFTKYADFADRKNLDCPELIRAVRFVGNKYRNLDAIDGG